MMNQKQPSAFLQQHDAVFVAGHRGMVGSAILRRLQAEDYPHLITRSRKELDLTDQQATDDFFSRQQIDVVVLAAAKVGGIHANKTLPAEFIYQNLMIQTNVIQAAFRTGVRKLLFLGSSCIYPKHAGQPMSEEMLLSGYLEPSNEPYAVAKIAGIKLCASYNRQYGTDFRAAMPTNLYGPQDSFDLENSHVLPALIRKFHLAKLAVEKNWRGIEKDEAVFGPIPTDLRDQLHACCHPEKRPMAPGKVIVRLWGSGTPRREFLHVDDLSSACHTLMGLSRAQYRDLCNATSGQPSADSAVGEHAPLPAVSHVNVGAGKDVTIQELAGIVKKIVGYRGEETWDRLRPDGTPRKLLDITRLTRTGWQPRIDLRQGIRDTYAWYQRQTEQTGSENRARQR